MRLPKWLSADASEEGKRRFNKAQISAAARLKRRELPPLTGVSLRCFLDRNAAPGSRRIKRTAVVTLGDMIRWEWRCALSEKTWVGKLAPEEKNKRERKKVGKKERRHIRTIKPVNYDVSYYVTDALLVQVRAP